MIRHIVIVKWRRDTTEGEIVEAFKAARVLLDDIDAVERVTIGRNRAEVDHGFTHVLIVDMADGDALRSYLDHPSRVRYLHEHMLPLEEQRIEIDVGVDMTLRRDAKVRDWEHGASAGMSFLIDE